MLPFEQGGLDSLCGIYSIVNADCIINKTTIEGSQKLFIKIIKHLAEHDLLASILTGGMRLKHIKAILVDVIGERIPYQKLHFAGVLKPDLITFWAELMSFLTEDHKRAVLLGIEGVYEHWTIVKEISENRIHLFDSDSLCRLNRVNCTTGEVRGRRHHVFLPAQTYFLGRA